MQSLEKLRERLKVAYNVVVLTGAGISAASGVPTFRGKDGLWNKFKPQELANVDAFLKNPELVAKGSSLKFLSIAQGDADLYPRMAPTMEWDTCAAHIILEEAGGSVVQADNQETPLLYNKENLRNPNFIAKAKEVVH